MDDLGIFPSILGHPHISIYIIVCHRTTTNIKPASTNINQHQPTSTNIHNILNILTLTTATTFRMAFGVTFQVISKNWASVLGFSMFRKACKLVSLLQKEASESTTSCRLLFSQTCHDFPVPSYEFAITICAFVAWAHQLSCRRG